jgi:3',5'-cyclic AMP phosphodiesterase CpdA
MIIVQLSDTHIDAVGPNGAARLADLERCVADINRLEPRPDVVIHTGDVAHNAKPVEYESAKRALSALSCPFYVAAGNRDDRAAIRATFATADWPPIDASFLQYRVETLPVRLIAIDTLSENSNKGAFCQARADKLSAVLTEGAPRPTAIFMHHPPFVIHESDYPVQFESWDSVERMERALAGHRHVVGMFCGHSHRNVGGRVGETPIRSMPSVAVDLRLGPYPAELASVPLYMLHRLDGERGFVSEVRAAR